MKKYILLMSILILGCKKAKNNSSKNVEIDISVKEVKYITAKSGLIYRDKPKGKRLGTFDFNEKINVTSHTSIFEEIRNGNKITKGEWVGVHLGNKVVYIFNGYLSDTKSKINVEDVKSFMGDDVWVSQDFKNILEETKSHQKAFYYGFSLQLKLNKDKKKSILEGYLPKAQDDVIYSIESLLKEEDPKLIEINNKTLTIKTKGKKHLFYKSNYGSANSVFEQWFQGNYTLKNENGTKNYTSKKINYTSELQNDFMFIDNKIYRVDGNKENTYVLSEIKFTESKKEDEKWEFGGDFEYDIVYITPTGKKATLTKL